MDLPLLHVGNHAFVEANDVFHSWGLVDPVAIDQVLCRTFSCPLREAALGLAVHGYSSRAQALDSLRGKHTAVQHELTGLPADDDTRRKHGMISGRRIW